MVQHRPRGRQSACGHSGPAPGGREIHQAEGEYRIVHANGDIRWIRDSGVATSSQKRLRVDGVVSDFTERKRAEDELFEMQEQFRVLAESSLTGIYLIIEGRFRYVNPAFARMFGYTVEEVVGGLGPSDLVYPDDRPIVADNIRRRVEGELEGLRYEFRGLRKDGTAFPVEVHGGRMERGGQIAVLGTLVDNTERKRAEEELRASEIRFRTLVDYAADMILLRDDNERLIDVNQYACESLGNTREELIGMTPRGLIDPNEDPAFFRSVGERLKAGELFGFESGFRRKDGTVFPVEVRVRPFSQRGRRYFLGIARDITERKQIEDVLRQREKQIRDVIETIPALAWTSGTDGSIDFINRRWQEFSGLSLEQSLGFGWHAALHPKDAPEFLDKWRAALLDGEPIEAEVRLRCAKSGECRWFLARSIPLRDEKGNIVRWYGTATDIDDRKRAEERLQDENVTLREEIDHASMFEEVVGTAPALKRGLAAVSKVAPTDSTVLITGETGTGKELIARAIHKKSARAARPFVTVNCAAIPQSLISSELFGHEKRAFTGALQRRPGRFEVAEGGTIFLDEVGELPSETQIALLRVLQEREFQRVGGSQTIRMNVRVLAATNRDLRKAIAADAFRQDLFYRLNVFPIQIPPLRERREDIPMLVDYFVDRFARKTGKKIRGIKDSAIDLLVYYNWPGNIRELQNVIERAVILCDGDTMSIDESWLLQGAPSNHSAGGALSRKSPTEEREIIEKALIESGGRVSGSSGAAARLGIAASTLEYKIRQLRINKHDFKKYLQDA